MTTAPPVQPVGSAAVLLFAIELSDDVDPTALATVALALLTLLTVVLGVRALRRSKDEIDLSRREVEEAHRPVLIPINDQNQELREYDAPTVYRAIPRYKQNSRIVVPIKNIGSGPALKIIVWIALLDDSGLPAHAGKPRQWHSERLLGLGVMEMTTATVYIPGLTSLTDFGLALTYVDVAEKTWTTWADYSAREDGSYVSMFIDQNKPSGDATAKGWRR